eukprot:293114-Rhodomonas_salina.1
MAILGPFSSFLLRPRGPDFLPTPILRAPYPLLHFRSQYPCSHPLDFPLYTPHTSQPPLSAEWGGLQRDLSNISYRPQHTLCNDQDWHSVRCWERARAAPLPAQLALAKSGNSDLYGAPASLFDLLRLGSS